MPKQKTIPHRNKSPHGWWIFGEVQKWVSDGRAEPKPSSRYRVWENLRLIQASTREVAYRKAVKLAKQGLPSRTVGGEWQFAGLSLLLPIYEELEDGAEVLWTDRGRLSYRQIQKLVRPKEDLPIFDDRERA